MLDSGEFTYRAYQDSRVKQHPGFTEGASGLLYLAIRKETGNEP